MPACAFILSCMSVPDDYQVLLQQVRASYLASPEMTDFAPFPKAPASQKMTPHRRDACTLLQNDTALCSETHPRLLQVIRTIGPGMRWRETYKEGAAETAFMSRWGCFSVIGEGGPFASDHVRVFVVYMPAGLFYPWHRHPAEEMYLVVAGRASFTCAGQPARVVTEGETVYHAGHLPHALETTDSPVLCLVAWRTHLNTPPVLVPAPALSA